MIARLGSIRFSGLKSPSDLTRNTAVDYAEHALFGRKPKLQQVGQALDTIELQIELHAKFCNPASEIRAIRKAMAAATVMPFTLGSGEFLGRFVITQASETWRKTFADGTLLAAGLSLSLKEAAVQAGNAIVELAKVTAFAALPNNPVVSVVNNALPVAGGGLEAAEKVRKARSASEKLRNAGQRASAVISRQQQFLRQAQTQAQAVADGVNEARAIVVAGQSQIQNAQRAIDKLEEAAEKAIALKDASSLGDILTAVEAASALSESMQIADQACSGLAGQVVTRQYP